MVEVKGEKMLDASEKESLGQVLEELYKNVSNT